MMKSRRCPDEAGVPLPPRRVVASPADAPGGGVGRGGVIGVKGRHVALQHGVDVVGDGAVPPARLRELVQRDDAVLVEVQRLAGKGGGRE